MAEDAQTEELHDVATALAWAASGAKAGERVSKRALGVRAYSGRGSAEPGPGEEPGRGGTKEAYHGELVGVVGII